MLFFQSVCNGPLLSLEACFLSVNAVGTMASKPIVSGQGAVLLNSGLCWRNVRPSQSFGWSAAGISGDNRLFTCDCFSKSSCSSF